MAVTSNANSHVIVTINGVAIKVPQGTNSFQDIVARAARVGAAAVTAKLITVNSSPSNPTSLNANGSYAIQGGENFTVA